MRCKGKGKYSLRQIDKILKDNGYSLVRSNKHYIYENDKGDFIAIPHNCKDSVIRTEFKKHNIQVR